MEKIKRDKHSVKIYCISPFAILAKFFDKLVEFEYEVYIIKDIDKYKLLQVLDKEILNVIFFCMRDAKEIEDWIGFVEKIKKTGETYILQTGVFVKSHIDQETRNRLLLNNVPVIQESFILQHPLQAIKSIFDIFEAKGSRKHIRVKGHTLCEAYFYFKQKNIEKNIKGTISDISSHAFSCKIDLTDQLYFVPGFYFNEVILILKGVRIPVTAKIYGYSKKDSDLFIFELYELKIKDNKFYYENDLPRDKKIKLYNYIRFSLKKDIQDKMDSVNLKKAQG